MHLKPSKTGAVYFFTVPPIKDFTSSADNTIANSAHVICRLRKKRGVGEKPYLAVFLQNNKSFFLDFANFSC